MSPKPKEETIAVSFRLPKSMVDELQRRAAQLTRNDPTMSYNRSDVARALLMDALRAARPPKPKRR